MPTGYTHDVQTGEVTNFNDFAKRCARAFGAYVTLRDSPSSMELPRSVGYDSYHQKELDKSKDDLIILDNLTIDQLTKRSFDEYEEDLKRYETNIQECKLFEVRYTTMLDKVKEWTPPTDEHVAFKEFMIQQLTDSIQYDCNTSYY